MSNTTIMEPGNYNMQLNGLDNLSPGTYSAMLILQTTFGEQYELPFRVTISSNAPAVPVLQSVANGSQLGWNQMPFVFTWQPVNNATGYVFQLSADMNFSTITEQQSVISNSYTLGFNLPLGNYYWRVRASNECGLSPWSEVFNFQSVVSRVETPATPEFGIFPNPVRDNLSVQLYHEGRFAFVITDISGRVVTTFQTEPGKKSYSFNLEHLPAGVYLIIGKNTSRKFIKE